MPFSKIHSLGGSQFSTSNFPAQAQDAVLTCLRLPNPAKSEYGRDAQSYFHHLTTNRKLVGCIDQRIGSTLSLTLYDPAKGTDLDTVSELPAKY